MLHLTDETAKRLLSGDPELLSYFRKHLRTDCVDCEEYLAQSDLLDGLTDGLLASVAPLPAEDGTGWRSVRRKMRGKSGSFAGLTAALGGISCVVLVVALGRLAPAGAGYDTGVKGAPHVQLELQLAWQGADGGVRRVDPGAQLPSSGRLLFRYHSSEALAGRLYQKKEGATPVLLGELPLEAGTHDLGNSAGLVGVDLSDEEGPTTFILEAEPEGGEPARAAASVRIAPGEE